MNSPFREISQCDLCTILSGYLWSVEFNEERGKQQVVYNIFCKVGSLVPLLYG